jgi:hypothetical protein
MAILTITNNSGVVLLTPFNIGTTVFNKCAATPEARPITVYTDADFFPLQEGDFVYTDVEGTTPFYTGLDTVRYYFEGADLEFGTGIDGGVLTYTCK